MKLKKGDKIKVEAVRMQIYAQPGYVSKERASIKTLTVTNVLGGDEYLVKISGLYLNLKYGTRILKSGRLHLKDTMGWLTTSPPRPCKWEVEVLEVD